MSRHAPKLRPFERHWLPLLGAFCLLLAAPALGAEPLRREFSLEFEASAGASGYELVFENKAPGIPAHAFATHEARWTGVLPPGSYRMRLRALDQRHVPGEWSEWMDVNIPYPAVTLNEPVADAVLETPHTDKVDVTFVWAPLCDDCRYTLTIRNGQDVTFTTTLVETKTSVPLGVGKAYTWGVVASDSIGTPGTSLAGRTLQIKGGPLASPILTTPFDPKTGTIAWTRPEDSESVKIVLKYKPDKKKKARVVRQETASTQQDFTMSADAPAGYYQLEVTALAPLRAPSKRLLHRFQWKIPTSVAPVATAAPVEPSQVSPNFMSVAWTPKWERYEIIKTGSKAYLDAIFPASGQAHLEYFFSDHFGILIDERLAFAQLPGGDSTLLLSIASSQVQGLAHLTWRDFWFDFGLGYMNRDIYLLESHTGGHGYIGKRTDLSSVIGQAALTYWWTPRSGAKGMVAGALPLDDSSSIMRADYFYDSRIGAFNHFGNQDKWFLYLFYHYEFAQFIAKSTPDRSNPYRVFQRFYGGGIEAGWRF